MTYSHIGFFNVKVLNIAMANDVFHGFTKCFFKFRYSGKMRWVGNLQYIVGPQYGTVAIEGYLHLNVLFSCKKSISVSVCASLINKRCLDK
jgi:hypothetical protein